MNSYEKEQILQFIEKKDVKFIRLQFSDIFGQIKNMAVTDRQFRKAVESSFMFDGSSIEGFSRIEESDMNLVPDPQTLALMPWRPQQGSVARFICDVVTPDGKPFEGDPRAVLKKAAEYAQSLGYVMNVGPECEFFLFHTDDNGAPTTITQDTAGYFDLAPIDLGENARREMCLVLEDMGFEVEASHHEDAAGQHEIDFKYSDALSAADNILTFKNVVKSIAQKHGLYASFMPKPLNNANGSGLHLNLSLSKGGINVFNDPNDSLGMSKAAYSFVAGIMKHIKAITAFANPIVNSYKRLVPDYEAPAYIAWSSKNRSPLIRIPASPNGDIRVELRSPDAACNPYMTLALLLMAGLEGINNNLTPPAQINKNLYQMTSAERTELGIENLPTSLKEAIDEVKKDSEFIKSVLGSHIYTKYCDAKEREWDSYRKQVHEWEIKEYLGTF